MKPLFLIPACCLAVALIAPLRSLADQTSPPPGNTGVAVQLPPPTACQVVKSSGNYNVWERYTYEKAPNGTIVARRHSYTELGAGLNYLQNGQWTASKEEINVLPQGGAAATQGQQQAYFPGDIYQGAIELTTPDGQQLQSRPMGIFYDDGTSTVLIAELTNSIGQLVSPNQVVYPNAFTGFKADLICTYRKGGFECDLILREQPPAPETFGLSSQYTKLQLLTEFFNPPEPGQTTGAISRSDGLTDTTLTFGSTTFGHGKAFIVGDQTQQPSNKPEVRVYKRWLHLAGRTFLIEEVPYPRVSADIQTLPVPDSGTGTVPPGPLLNKVSGERLLVPGRLPQRSTNAVQIAKTDVRQEFGFVMDYTTLNSDQTNFTFQADTTYFITGTFTISGITTIEGGTVVKFDANGNSLYVNNVNCQTGPYRPAIFTAMDDDTVGEPISGSSGSPSGLYANYALCVEPTGNINLSHLRISYAWAAIQWDWPTTYNIIDTGEDIQILNGWIGFRGESEGLIQYYVYNSLVVNLGNTAFGGEGFSGGAVNVTVDGAQNFSSDGWHEGNGFYVSNSIIADISTLDDSIGVGGGYCAFYNSDTSSTYSLVPAWNTSSWPFQTVGAGNYYLATNTFQSFGTTNIDPVALAEIQTKTTWPPIVYSNTTISTATIFGAQAQRDTNAAPDLGYHYDPIDFFFGGVTALTNVTFIGGTAMGWFPLPGSSWEANGISLSNNAVATLSGTVRAPCIATYWANVQEGNGLWANSGGLGVFSGGGSYDPANPGQLIARFTHFSVLAGYQNFRDGPDGEPILFHATDCELYGGGGGYNPQLAFTNCLFYRSRVGQATGDSQYSFEGYREIYRNCTFYGGSLNLTHWESSPYWQVSIRDCSFDGSTLDFSPPWNNVITNWDWTWLDADYNATNNVTFVQEANLTALPGPDNVFPSGGFNWQSSWLGNFYLPPDSWLIDAGDVTADRVGLYWFTTQTNQTIEGSLNPVDLGYHYPAVDGSGNPVSTLVSGVPDYVSDPGGNGLPDTWEMQYFGNLNHFASDLDSVGYTLLYNYLHDLDPNMIKFTARLGNQHFNVTNATGSFLVLGGFPSYEAVLVNDTNLNDAVWSNYDGIVRMNLSPTDGVYQVELGLKGFATNATQSWIGTSVTLDRTKPQVFITNPATNTVPVPLIQLQGSSPEELQSVTFDVSNAVSIVTNQAGLLTGHFVDTNLMTFTTNYFQCYDIPLTNGLNTITVHATDLAGNVTVTNFSFTLDYSTVTNPVIQLTWPQDGMQICQSNFTLRGWVDDPTAFVLASITDTNGNVTVAIGQVARNGNLWVEHLPLTEGTNAVTLCVTNAAGYSSTTNISVVKSDMTLTLTSISGDLWNSTVGVSGTISDTGAAVWVNGVQGTNRGNGTWSATNVPVSADGMASFDLSTGAGGSFASTNMVKDPEVMIESARWSSSSADFLDSWEVDRVQGNFSATSGGIRTEHHEQQDTNRVAFSSTDVTDFIATNMNIVLEHYTDSGGSDVWRTNLGPVTIPLEEGSLSVQNEFGSPGGPGGESESAQVRMMLHTGGKGVARWRDIFSLSTSATERVTASGEIVDGPNVPYSQVTVDGQIVGADGLAWASYPRGASVDVTPQTGAPCYKPPTTGPSVWPLVISANGFNLSTNPLFCVGQFIEFSCTGMPGGTGMIGTNYLWIFNGIYVNDWTNTVPGVTPPACSTNYFINPQLLTDATPHAWWVSGGFPEVSVQCTVTYSNGSIISTAFGQGCGNLYMFRPNVHWNGANLGPVACDNYWEEDVGVTSIHFGTTLYPFYTPGIQFKTNIVSGIVSGSYAIGTYEPITVITSSSIEACGTNGITAHYTGSGLDGSVNALALTYNSGRMDYHDCPGVNCASDNKHVTRSDSFETTLMFNPNTLYSIAVPLKLVSWNWSGVADTNSGWNTNSGWWQLTSSSHNISVNDQDTMNFPTWTNVLNGLGGYNLLTNNSCN